MDRRRRIARPTLEPIEARELLSGLMVALASSTPQLTLSQEAGIASNLGNQLAAGTSVSVSATATAGSGATSATPTNEFIAPPVGVAPTPQELKREGFFFKFTGKYIIGPPRFEDQSKTVYFKGVGTSSYFLHGDDQIGYVVNNDPSIPASGNSTAYDRNNNTNAAYSLDLIAVPGAVNAQGLPTEFTINTDVNASAGIFDQATATGLLKIDYLPGLQKHKGYSEGNAKVSITGLAYTLGTISNLSVLGTVNSLNPDKISF